MELIKVLSNPVRIQAMQYLQIHGEATTKQISEAIKDVPTPTLYRHINTLLKEEVLLVKEERKVRESLERLLIIIKDKFAEAENSDIANSAHQFLMELYWKFKTYCTNQKTNPKKDRLSMRTRVLFLTDEAFDNFMLDIVAVMLIMGTGKTDRNGNQKGLHKDFYKNLAELFATNGFVCICYDKRGAYETQGNYNTTGLNDLTDDATSVFRYTKALSFVDSHKIIVCGHS